MNGIYILVIAVCVLLSGFFSATETAFSSMNRTKLRTMAEKGNARAKLACSLSDQYDKLLSTILIGNNIVNIACASVATILFVGLCGDAGATVSTVITTIVVLIFGEVSPKSIAKDCPEAFAMFSAPIIRVLVWVFSPLCFLFTQWKRLLSRMLHLTPDNRMSQEELLMLVDEVQQDGSIDETESDLLKNAIEFTELEASDILIHRVELAALPIDASKQEVAEMFAQTRYSRLLVYEESIDHIIGVVHQKDFYLGSGITGKPLRQIVSPVLFVLEHTKIRLILTRMQKVKTQLAVVLDEYGGTCGIVTMEDILEELVGEIWDEHDEVETPIQPCAPDTWLVDATADFDDFSKFFHIRSDTEMVSVSGWVMEQFGRVPSAGDSFQTQGLRITVKKVDKHRIEELEVQRLPAPAQAAAE